MMYETRKNITNMSLNNKKAYFLKLKKEYNRLTSIPAGKLKAPIKAYSFTGGHHMYVEYDGYHNIDKYLLVKDPGYKLPEIKDKIISEMEVSFFGKKGINKEIKYFLTDA